MLASLLAKADLGGERDQHLLKDTVLYSPYWSLNVMSGILTISDERGAGPAYRQYCRVSAPNVMAIKIGFAIEIHRVVAGSGPVIGSVCSCGLHNLIGFFAIRAQWFVVRTPQDDH